MESGLPMWSDLHHLGSMDNKLKLYEAYANTNGNLTESNEKENVEAFNRLADLGSKPVINTDYIAISLMLINNELTVTNQPELVKLVKVNPTSYLLKLLEQDNRIVEFPIKSSSVNVPIITVLFDSLNSYDKFCMFVELQFSATLPKYKDKNITENKMSSIMKGIVDEGDWTGGIINWKKEVTSKHGPDVTFKKRKLPGVNGKTDTYATNSQGKVVGVYQHHNDMGRVLSETDAIKGADGKRCWKGKRYAGTENGKDKCIPVKEGDVVPFKKKTDKDKYNAAIAKQRGPLPISYIDPESAITVKSSKPGDPIEIPDEYQDINLKNKVRGVPKQNQTNFEVWGNDHGYYVFGNNTNAVLSAWPNGEMMVLSDPSDSKGRENCQRFAKQVMKPIELDSLRPKLKNKILQKMSMIDQSVNEGVIVGHDANDPEVAILGGAGTMSLSRLKKKAHGEALQLADDIAKGNYSASSYNMKQLHNTLNTIVAAEEEMKKLYFGEDHTDEFAAEKTAAVNPYGGLKDRQFRSAIGEGIQLAETPDTSGPVGTQPGGWRRTDSPDLQEELSREDVDSIERFADKLYKKLGIDVTFTKHFMDRVNDERNGKPINGAELVRLFKKEYERWGKQVAQLGPDVEGTFKDLTTDINLPFVLRWDRDEEELDLIAKTVMRKKNFKTSNTEFPVDEDTSFGTGMGQGGNAGQSYRKFTPKSAGTFKKESAIMKGLTR